MRVLVTGGSGFFGRVLCKALSARGDQVVVATRNPSNRGWLGVIPGAKLVEGDTTRAGAWQALVGEVDAVVHLAAPGLYVAPWPQVEDAYAAAKTRAAAELATAVVAAAKPPRVVLYASSVAAYGVRPEVVDERAAPHDGPHAALFARAEQALRPAADKTRVVALRMGTILGAGGLLAAWRTTDDPPPPSSAGLSWIHLDDAVSTTLLALDKGVRNAFNVTAPDPVDVATFVGAVTPRLQKAPQQGLVGLLFGAKKQRPDDGRVVLFAGPKARPAAALALGYAFKYPKLDAALRALR